MAITKPLSQPDATAAHASGRRWPSEEDGFLRLPGSEPNRSSPDCAAPISAWTRRGPGTGSAR